MKSSLAAIAAAAVLALLSGAPEASAQQGSDVCLQLEARLTALDRGGRRQDPRQIEQAINKQRYELDRTKSYAGGLGCGKRFIFGPTPPAECGPLNARIRQMEVSLDRLQSQAVQAGQGGGGDPRRRDLLFSLARNQCGPQYRLVERRVQAPQEKKGFFSMLFGGGSSEAPREETVIEPEIVPEAAPRSGSGSAFRTVCVRTCDGFFFPVSYSTSRNAFQRDEAICRATCPGSEAKLFAYPNPGGQMEQASGVDGQPYTELPNAFRYRKEFVAGCSCKPEGMSWAEALAGVEDKTVKKGDIIVDEQKAEELSRPGQPATPTAQARTRPERSRPAEPDGEPEPELRTPRRDPDAPSDVIILNERTPRRGEIEGRPLDGPDVERIPQ
jgi:hypothetical protein